MSELDDDLREEVNNALEDDEVDEAAEHDQDDIADDDSPEDEADDVQEEDEDDDESDQKRKPSGKDKTRSAPADDDDLEEDDDPSLDYARPEFGTGNTPQVKEFDIRTLPKDPETGLIDPVEANKLINEFYANQGKATTESRQREEQTKNLLTQQWTRVSKKYPAVYSNPRLRDMARDMHLNSIGTANYLTPAQAAAKIERTRRELVKTGYKSAKTRRSVETMTRTERNSGRPSTGKLSDYEKAKARANSRDPQKAKAGRMELLRIRREARRRAG
ncbi:hypothetical protein HZA56_14005 [Candidatus Poribacteria bacterium]|nr:hypothetical protein [Candidatus Poribacteria bacterium]